MDYDNDGLSPPKGSAPEHVDGALYYVWNPTTQQWDAVMPEV